MSDVCAVCWANNKVVAVASNHLTHEPNRNCKRYSRVKKALIDVPQPHLMRKYNAYMGGVDQLDGYWNNLRPYIRRETYWTQLINLVCLLQVAAYRLFCQMHPAKRTSQLQFLRSIVHQYVGFDRKAVKINVSVPNLLPTNTNSHFLEQSTQGRCKYCKKNCRTMCPTCNVRLHVNCFPLYHSN